MDLHAIGEGLDVERDRVCVGGVPEHDGKQAQEGEHATGERVDEELDGRPPPLVVPPDPNQKEQRHERELEEHVEQNHVASREHPEHRCLEHQQQHVEPDRAIRDGVPAHKYGSQ